MFRWIFGLLTFCLSTTFLYLDPSNGCLKEPINDNVRSTHMMQNALNGCTNFANESLCVYKPDITTYRGFAYILSFQLPCRGGREPRCWGREPRCWGSEPHCWGPEPYCWGPAPSYWGHSNCISNELSCVWQSEICTSTYSMIHEIKMYTDLNEMNFDGLTILLVSNI